MRKLCLVFVCVFFCIGYADAADRNQKNVLSRQSTQNTQTTINRSTQKRLVTSRAATNNISLKQTSPRITTKKSVVGRSATLNKPISSRITFKPTRTSRAASNTTTKTFGNNYNSCRDAYFTCMDQFCAVQNETYRRCVCSSKLREIQNQEKLLSQTADNLQDFDDLNISMISKNAAEVKAMLSATDGETAMKQDSSDSAATLKNISNVLNKTKQQSVSVQSGTDITDNIKSIWSTTNFIAGTDLTNLTGDALFNAVHSQCVELVSQSCATSDLKMISSAYGMYIENDCTVLENNLKNKITAANTSIRATRHKMQDARLENYDTHNSLNLNECIANVRTNITADTACGKGYIHCLDFTGKYINSTTGEAIYSPEFYQIENQLSLSGDILHNNKNTTFVNMLNQKRVFAQKDLDLCQDDADEVWNEFLRQALVEIYQAQQKRVETAKAECLQVVNECYLNQSDVLKQYTQNTLPTVFLQTMELSEEMCSDKLNTCSNLYGGGPEGLEILIATMTGITDATIEQSCPELLENFAQSICAVPSGDSQHKYPYGCRKYTPGESIYARKPMCNKTATNPFSQSSLLVTQASDNYDYSWYMKICKNSIYKKRYTRCNVGYYLRDLDNAYEPYYAVTQEAATAPECAPCPETQFCAGDKNAPSDINTELYETCGQYYIGSIYHQLVTYALQNCTRTAKQSDYLLSETLMAQIDKIAKNISASLISMLSEECKDLNGIWVDTEWADKDHDGQHDVSGDKLLLQFYSNTSANTIWGYCKDPSK